MLLSRQELTDDSVVIVLIVRVSSLVPLVELGKPEKTLKLVARGVFRRVLVCRDDDALVVCNTKVRLS